MNTYITIIILFLISYIIFSGYDIYRASEASKPLQAITAYEQHPVNPKIHILITGDSTGHGTGASKPEESIAGRIGRDYPHADITNIAINGLKVAGLKDSLHTYFSNNPKIHYDLILFQIGGNDVTHFTNLANVGSDLDNCIQEASLFADHIILMSTGKVGNAPTFHFPITQIINIRTRKVRTILMKQAAQYQKVSYADMYKEGKDDVFITDPDRYYAADKFHPSSDGYAIWYRYLKPVISSLF
jgi:lysophospholipase L1-like esterase